MRPVSVEPVGPVGVQREQNFSRKVTSGRITEQKYFATNAFQWENFLYLFLPFILNGPTSSNIAIDSDD